jgi:phenylpropionate dioxygenase-like ring-hydroxylating dioxygenase large terminal subunit
MQMKEPGEWMDTAPYISQLDFSSLRMRIPTDRYHSREYQERERERLWMRVWQIAGRAEELPNAGDWKVHTIYDQSFILVRGKDGIIRGFVNACRHRGNRLCVDRGHSARFTCRYHLWTFGLDGKLLGASKDFDGPLEDFVGPKDELGLIPIAVECFAGFIFLNPDPQARPLEEFLGPAKQVLEAYRMDEWIAVGVNVRETLECNWKVVMDAFGEGYHIRGIHPELIGLSDLIRERFHTFGLHCASTVPFGPDSGGDVEKEAESISSVPTEQFPLYAEILPRFAEMTASFRAADGKLVFPAGTTPRSLFQQMIREMWTAKGLDVSRLTNTQMTDYQYWLFFPNVFIQVCVGDATVIVIDPHPSGDYNRSVWHVMFLHWVPPEERAAKLTPVQTMREGEHFTYHYVLDQDFRQMPIAQEGLRNRLYREMVLTKHEPRVAYFHGSLDRWIESEAEPASTRAAHASSRYLGHER